MIEFVRSAKGAFSSQPGASPQDLARMNKRWKRDSTERLRDRVT